MVTINCLKRDFEERIEKGDDMVRKQAWGTVSRRSFIAGAAAAVAAGTVAGCSPKTSGTEKRPTDGENLASTSSETVVTNSFCRGGCCSNCYQKVHVRDGQIVRLTAGDTPDPRYRGICSRGVSQPINTYTDNRLQYPMKRVGERGEGKFERISWDEAIETVASEWNRIAEQYGPAAFGVKAGAGNAALVNGAGGAIARLMNITGASKFFAPVDQAYVHSCANTTGADLYVGGSAFSTFDDSKAVVCWGANPAVSNPQDFHWELEARDAGIPFIVIDPVFGPVASKADWYIPINPSTDGALALGILKVILDNGQEDKEFCRQFTNSTYLVKESDGMFLRMSDLGIEPEAIDDATGTPIDPVVVWDESDNTPKPFDQAVTPSLEGVPEVEGIKVKTSYTITKEAVAKYTLDYTSKITGVPGDDIKKLAEIYADGPVATTDFLGPDHYRNGHYNYQCMNTMMIMTHNVGRRGAVMRRGYAFSIIGNDEKALMPTDKAGNKCQGQGPTYLTHRLNEMIDAGKYGDEDAQLKGLYVFADGFVSVGTQREHLVEALKKIEFIVVCDIWMTETVSYADIVLPSCGWYETTDLFNAQSLHPYAMYAEAAIEPLYESKSSFDIQKMIAEKMGYGDFFDVTLDEFMEEWLDSDLAKTLGITLEALREKQAIHSWPTEEFISGEGGVFQTADTRAMIYREAPFGLYNQGRTEPIDYSKEMPVYWEPASEADVNSPIREKFPFHAMNEHMRTRTHTQWAAVGQLQEYYPEPFARMHPQDAAELGVEEGDVIKLYNDRGSVTMKATVSGGVPRKMVVIPRGHMKNEFIDGHFGDISSDQYNQICSNQAFSDQAIAIEKQ